MLAAGPAANLLLALLAGALFLSRGYDWNDDSFLTSGASVFSLGLFSAAMFSLLLFLVNLFPCRVGGFSSDGAKLLLLLRGGPKAERQTALSVLVGMSYAGRRARGWPPGLVERAIALPDGSAEDTAGALLAYYWLLDQGDAAGAAQFLDRALAGRDRYPTASRPVLFLEAAYFTARHRGDAAGARTFLKQSKGGMLVQRWAELRAEAAVLLAEGNRDAARLRAQEGLAAIRRMGDADTGSENADWLREIVTLCDSAAPSPPSVPEAADRGMA
jgi:hypothetical protein